MLTKLETRILYLIAKEGGQIQHYKISQATSRRPARDRDRALQALELHHELIKSAQTPSKRRPGGAPGLAYWLTPAGIEVARELVDRGAMKDPGPFLELGAEPLGERAEP